MKPDILNKLRLILLMCPYETWSNRDTQMFFSKMIELKLDGYRSGYKHGVLPVDTTDFIANHILIAEETPSGFNLVMGYRSILLTRCHEFLLPFPPLAVALAGNFFDHERAIQNIVSRYESNKAALSYEGCFTITPYVRQNTAYSKLIHELFMSIPYFYQYHNGIAESIAGGNVRFKVERLCQPIGYQPLALNGKVLEPITWPGTYQEQVRFFHLSQFSNHSKTLAEKYRFIWDERIEIGNNWIQNRKAA